MMFTLQVPIHGEGREGSEFKSLKTSFTHTYTYGPFGWVDLKEDGKMRFFYCRLLELGRKTSGEN